MHIRQLSAFFLLFFFLLINVTPSAAQSQLEWPDISQTNKPWTRWWWMGSAVDEANLTRGLELYSEAGLGGVEITPIYGVKGQEDQFIDYLSDGWVDRLVYTLEEASRLGLGVDMATGTGWPFGGPHVEADDASRYITHKTYELHGGQRLQEAIHFEQAPVLRTVLTRPELSDLKEPIRDNHNLQALALDQVRFPKALPLEALMAYSDAGDMVDLTAMVDDEGMLDWTAPAGSWTLYAVFQGWHGKMVERAAPGGEGYAINHFSGSVLENYLKPFDDAFEGRDISALRGFFNDSYEVDDASGEADWTPAFFDAFEERRGYDLRAHLPALFGNDTEDKNSRVRTDYRQTLSDLLLYEFTRNWTSWAHENGAITRNQAHGSPGSILDLYAATDIPETESVDMMRIKFAPSAAHVSGKQLAAAEASTWLNEHFLSNWADAKKGIDRYFLGGVNHIVYHGTAYSPADAPWPGWLFYAAVHYSPQNPLWKDFGTLNSYVSRSQSVLQAGLPANDVLLYLPLLDRYAQEDPSMLVHFHGLEPFEGMTVAEDAHLLQDRGYAFDFISDMQLHVTRAEEQQILAGDAAYQVVVVPAAERMPVSTLQTLMALAEQGATVIMHEQLPETVPGLGNLAAREMQFKALIDRMQFAAIAQAGIQSANVGEGRVILGDDLDALLVHAGVHRESFVDDGLEYIRRLRTDGKDYFIANWGEEAIDGWVPITTPAEAVAIFDPMRGHTGLASTRTNDEGRTEVYLQLAAGETVILRTHDAPVQGRRFAYIKPVAAPLDLEGEWQVQFVAGGPELPENMAIRELSSWTTFDNAALQSFSGTATYSIAFSMLDDSADAWVLDLGDVRESAVVRLNGDTLGTLIGPNYQLNIDAGLLQDRNMLEVDVTNKMANRIAEMDRQGIEWKKFYNINVSARLRENLGDDGVFNAAGWSPMPSGLIGPVKLTPVEIYRP